MDSLADTLRTTVEAAAARLLVLSEAETEARPDGEWCAKEVMGHLIDSAANNHARVVRAQFTDDLVFEGYDQGAWVRVQRAAGEPWPALVSLWQEYNLHLAHLIAGIPDETMRRPRVRHSLDQIAWQTVPADQPATLDYLIRDYIGHLQDHVRQILALTGQTTTVKPRDESSMNSDIVLLGPVSAGKSTQGRLLATALGRPQVSLDEERWRYYREIGYDDELAREIRRRGGFLALVMYWGQFDPYAVERLLAEHHGCVFDFGAAIYESRENLDRVRRALAHYPNVFLLLPSPEREESLRILRERDPDPPADLNFDFNRRFLQHPSYYALARRTIYTAGKTPEETRDEILRLLVQ